MNTVRDTGSAVLAAAVVVVVCVAVWFGYWWLHRDAVNREANIQRESFNFQQGAADGAEDTIHDIVILDANNGDPNQRAALVRQACRLIDRVQPPVPADLAAFHAKEC